MKKQTRTPAKTTATSPLPTYTCSHCKGKHAPWVKECLHKLLGH